MSHDSSFASEHEGSVWIWVEKEMLEKTLFLFSFSCANDLLQPPKNREERTPGGRAIVAFARESRTIVSERFLFISFGLRWWRLLVQMKIVGLVSFPPSLFCPLVMTPFFQLALFPSSSWFPHLRLSPSGASVGKEEEEEKCVRSNEFRRLDDAPERISPKIKAKLLCKKT